MPAAEERALLLLHMRQFADASGDLPVEFDPLVREAFGSDLAELAEVSAASVQRQVALAGIALLAAIVSLASRRRQGPGGRAASRSPSRSPAAAGTRRSPAPSARATAAEPAAHVIQPGTVGVTDSVLPCGILVYVAYKDSPHILTRVIDRRPVLPGRKFDLTPKLAEELGVDGVQRIRWVFAR